MLANLHHRRRRNLPRAGEIGVGAYRVNQCPNRGGGGSDRRWRVAASVPPSSKKTASA
jgi:hypothetical protein